MPQVNPGLCSDCTTERACFKHNEPLTEINDSLRVDTRNNPLTEINRVLILDKAPIDALRKLTAALRPVWDGGHFNDETTDAYRLALSVIGDYDAKPPAIQVERGLRDAAAILRALPVAVSSLRSVLFQLEHGEASDFLDGSVRVRGVDADAAKADLSWCRTELLRVLESLS